VGKLPRLLGEQRSALELSQPLPLSLVARQEAVRLGCVLGHDHGRFVVFPAL
jgi:hypothetical protein